MYSTDLALFQGDPIPHIATLSRLITPALSVCQALKVEHSLEDPQNGGQQQFSRVGR